ncbi:MAG: ABC transporter ATP-binding protein, partial [Betaproteobacteria bacterium]
TLREKNFTIVMIEQNFRFASGLADRFYVMEHGRIVHGFEAAQLQANMPMLNEFLGI